MFPPTRIAVLSAAAAALLTACGDPVTQPNAPAALRIVSGDGQIRFPDSRLMHELHVEVVDADGMRITDVDVRVDWVLESGDGALEPEVSFTGGGGIAVTTWVLGSGMGEQAVRATAEGLDPVVFTATAVPIGPIAFVSTRDVSFNPPTLDNDIAADLFVMQPDGTDPVRILRQEGTVNWVRQPTWSPDGARIAFVRALLVNPTNPVTQSLTPNGIHILHIPTYGATRAPPTTNSGFFLSMTHPAWSPNGTDLATVNGQIWVLSVTGSNVRSATTDRNLDPTWSPDGGTMAFGCASGICSQRLNDTGSRTALTNRSHDHAPDWAPDGSRLAFARTGTNRGIWVVDANGSAEHHLALGNYTSPSWGPDGQQLVAVLTHETGRRDIVHIDATTGVVANLTDGNGDNWDPAWRR